MFHTQSTTPQSWSAATLKALAQASALGVPVAFSSFPPRDGERSR